MLQKAVTDSSLCARGAGGGRLEAQRLWSGPPPCCRGWGWEEPRGLYRCGAEKGPAKPLVFPLASEVRYCRSELTDPEGRLTSCCPRERGQGSAQTLLLPGSLSKLPLPLSAPAVLISETHHLTLLHLPLRSLKQSFSSLCKH